MLSPIGLIAVAVAGAGAAILKFSNIGKNALAGLKSAFGDLLGGITDALLSGDVKLAADLMWKELRVVFLQGYAKIVEIFDNIRLPIIGFFLDITDALRATFATSQADLANIGGENLDARAGLLEESADKLKEAQAAAAKARTELQEAIEAARKARLKGKGFPGRTGKHGDFPEGTEPEIEAKDLKLTTTGTFNARSLLSLQAVGEDEEIAKNTAAILEQAKKTNRLLQGRGGVFTP
jgi:hypothetical protein